MVSFLIVLVILLLVISFGYLVFSILRDSRGSKDMAAGLQCFDENGKIVVDTNDRQLVWVKDITHTVTVSDVILDISVPGVSPSDTLVLYEGGKQGGTETAATLARNVSSAAYVIAENKVRVVSLSRIPIGTVITLNIFQFIKV